jgi:cytochrome c-type biogenesis protein CcmE
MNTLRKKRIGLIVLLLVGCISFVSLALMALKENINLFYSVSQIYNGEAPEDTAIRAGGMVMKNSLVRKDDTLNIEFKITDYQHELVVRYTGILPDLFKEGQGVVALGKIQGDIFYADQILAKHDEKYMPPEVSGSLKNKEGEK